MPFIQFCFSIFFGLNALAGATAWVDRADVLAWLAESGLAPGTEFDLGGSGPLTFRDADLESMTFSHPPGMQVDESGLRPLIHGLRATGFTSLRYVYYRADRRGV